MKFKKRFIVILLGLIIILSACNRASTEESISNHIEETANIENAFEAEQTDLLQLEDKEQAIYTEVISLNMKEMKKIKSLSKQATEVIDKRGEYITLEKESMDSSKKEFEKIESLSKKLENKKTEKIVTEMYEVMQSRYSIYDKLYKNYTDSLKLERKLYRLLSKEDTVQADIIKQAEKINKLYEKILQENDQFNLQTDTYNNLKKDFYKIADINVQYEKEGKDPEVPVKKAE